MATSFLVAKNRAFSKLAAAVNDSTTTFTVIAGQGANFPSTYPFHLTVEDEIVSVTNRSTDSLTVVRAQQGSSAAAHPVKAYIALHITAKSITDLNTAVNTLETYDVLTTRGDLIVHAASAPARLAKGADNTILAMGANDPEWKAPATILADLSGQAAAAFDFNGQVVKNIAVLQVNGATAAAYSRIGAGDTGHTLTSPNDLLVTGKLEVDGMTFLDGGLDISGLQSSGAITIKPSGDADDYFTFATVSDVPSLYGTGAYLRIGDAGATAHSLASEDDLMVSGKFEVKGLAYFDEDISIADGKAIQTGILDNDVVIFKAVDNDDQSLKEVGRLAGAANPYFAFGGASEFKFLNTGVAQFAGGVTFSASTTHADNISFSQGNFGDVTRRYQTADADAKMLVQTLPHVAEDANNVAVLALVDRDADNTDLGAGGADLSGITKPTLAVLNEASGAYGKLDCDSVYLLEKAAADADVAGDGQYWVKSQTPNEPWFTGDDGVDHPLLGHVYPLANTYVSGSGTAGSDNTAQTVKTVVIPANTLTQVGDRLRIRVYFKGDTGAGITMTNTVNTVTIADATDAGGADWYMTECWLHYIDSTHANIAEMAATPVTGSNTAENVAGFDWTSAQDVDIDQNQIASNHIIVFAIFLDVYPKGLI